MLPLGTALVPVHVDLADLLTSRGGAAMPWPLSFSFCIMTVSTFSPNTLELPRQRGAVGELCGCCGVSLGQAEAFCTAAGSGCQCTDTVLPFAEGWKTFSSLALLLCAGYLAVSCQPEQAVPAPQRRVLWAR